jgi:hypothetical protein
MENRNHIVNTYFAKANIGGVVSINDVREKEFDGKPLTMEEKNALINFDRFRLDVLNAQTDDHSFHKRYQELQIMANLGDYTEFLNEKYFL